MNTNSRSAICTFCRRPVTAGSGRFVGPGIVAHKRGECPAKSEARYRPNPKKMIALGNRWLAPALLAIVMAGATSAAGSGDHDWALLIPGERPICAKSEKACYSAREAIGAGRWRRDLTTSVFPHIDCRPSPGCFTPRENCIAGYTC